MSLQKIKISFIIPVYNGEKFLERCLRAILSQNSFLSLEVIVVNNASTDNSRHIAEQFNVTILDEPHRGRSHARNAGIKKAQGEWIAFVDSDTILEHDWLKCFEPFLDDNVFDCFQGKIIPAADFKHSFYEFRKELISHQTNGTFCHLDHVYFTAPNCNSAACLIRGSLLNEIDGFDPELKTYEDIDLSWRLWRSGASFCVVKEAKAHVYWGGGFYFKYFIRSYHMGRGLSIFARKWGIKNSNNMLPDYNSTGFKSARDKFYFTLMYLFQSIGFLEIKLKFGLPDIKKTTPLHQTNSKKIKKIFYDQKCFALKGDQRLLVNSTHIIIRNIRNFSSLRLEHGLPRIQKDDIKKIFFEQKDLFLNENIGFLFE